MTLGIFWLLIFFLFVGFAIMPLWNAIFAVMAAFLGMLYIVAHYVSGNLPAAYDNTIMAKALDKAVEGIHEAHTLGNVYLCNLFYIVALNIAASLHPSTERTLSVSKIYEAKYSEPLPIPTHFKH